MEKITINWVKRTPRTSASGKPYVSLSLKTKEYGDSYLSGFGNKENESWNVGDVVEVTIKKVEKDGKEYINFETLKKEDIKEAKVVDMLSQLMTKVGLMSAKIDVIYEKHKDTKFTGLRGETVDMNPFKEDEPEY